MASFWEPRSSNLRRTELKKKVSITKRACLGTGVLNILNERNYIYIVLDTAAAYIIPKRVFNSEDHTIEFFNQLEQLHNNYS